MAIRFLSSETIDGNLSFTGDGLISSDTNDASDNAQIVITGGGATGDTRGASVHLSGNEHGNGGLLQLRAGDGTVGGIRFYTGGSERMRILEPLITFPTITELRGDISSAAFAVGNMGDASSQMMVASRGFLTFNVSNTGSALNATERLRITATGAISVGSTGTNYGTSGQVLTSGGNSNPTWTTPTTGTVKGTGTATRVAFWSASDTLSSNADLYWNNSLDRLGIGTTSPDRTLDVRGTGMSIYGTGGYTELMLRGQVEGTGTVRNVGSWHWSIRSDIGGDNDDLKLVRFVTGSYVGIAMQVQNSTGDIFFGNTVVNPASGFSNQRGFGYDNSTGNLEVASTSGTAMQIGRNESTDGLILQLRKEGTVKHSIGSVESYFTGEVGINVTSPNTSLHVGSSGTNAYSATITKGSNMKGIMNTLSNNADDMVGIYFATGTTTEGTHWSGITGSRSDSATHWGTQLNFYTHADDVANLNDATQKMVILGNGNVGIGTTSPSQNLQVVGSIYPSGVGSTLNL